MTIAILPARGVASEYPETTVNSTVHQQSVGPYRPCRIAGYLEDCCIHRPSKDRELALRWRRGALQKTGRTER